MGIVHMENLKRPLTKGFLNVVLPLDDSGSHSGLTHASVSIASGNAVLRPISVHKSRKNFLILFLVQANLQKKLH